MVERVLLIEDTITANSTLFSGLSDISEVIRARSVIEAIAQIARFGPLTIVADCPIGGEDAPEVMSALRDFGFEGAIIVVHRAKTPEEHEALISAGAFAAIPKPVDQTTLIAAVLRAADTPR